MLHLVNPGATSMPDLHPVHGRVRSIEGNPDAIADVGTACRLSRHRCTHVSLNYARHRTQKEDVWSVNAAGDCSFAKPSVA